MKPTQALLLLALTGCYLNHYPVTPAVVEGSVFEVVGDSAESPSGMLEATAWIVAPGWLVTAGHFCHGVEGDVTAISTAHRVYPGLKRRVYAGTPDLCLLEAPQIHADALVIAADTPAPGALCRYTGFPQAALFHAEGTVQVNEQAGGCQIYVDHGASGSALYNGRGVFGVLVRTNLEHTFAEAVPLADLRKFLEEEDIAYSHEPAPVESPTWATGD